MRRGKTHVLFLIDTMHGGGAERVVVELLQHIDRARFRLSLALFRAEGEMLGAVPSDVPVIDLQGTAGLRGLFRGVRRLKQVIEERQPDAVLSCLTYSNRALARTVFLARPDCRTVLTEHNNLTRNLGEQRSALRRLVAALEVRLFYPWADQVVTVSEGIKEDLTTSYGLPAERTSVIYNPVDVSMVADRAREPVAWPWPDGAAHRVLVAVGRLVPQKGYPDLLRAFARVRAEQPCRLVILGEGALRGELEAQIQRQGLAGDVYLPGYVDNPWAHMRRADLYVSASRWEGFHLTIAEAMACRTPVVATDCDFGPREIITHGKDGLLVPVGDPAALSRQILGVLADEQKRQRLIQAGARRAADFDSARIARQYEHIVEAGQPTSAAEHACG